MRAFWNSFPFRQVFMTLVLVLITLAIWIWIVPLVRGGTHISFGDTPTAIVAAKADPATTNPTATTDPTATATQAATVTPVLAVTQAPAPVPVENPVICSPDLNDTSTMTVDFRCPSWKGTWANWLESLDKRWNRDGNESVTSAIWTKRGMALPVPPGWTLYPAQNTRVDLYQVVGTQGRTYFCYGDGAMHLTRVSEWTVFLASDWNEEKAGKCMLATDYDYGQNNLQYPVTGLLEVGNDGLVILPATVSAPTQTPATSTKAAAPSAPEAPTAIPTQAMTEEPSATYLTPPCQPPTDNGWEWNFEGYWFRDNTNQISFTVPDWIGDVHYYNGVTRETKRVSTGDLVEGASTATAWCAR